MSKKQKINSNIDYSMLELKGLPNNYFQSNRDRYLAKVRKFKEIDANSILVIRGGESTSLYDTDQDLTYFTQESNFFYLTGVKEQGLNAILDLTSSKLHLFYEQPEDDMRIWIKVLTKEDLAKKYEMDISLIHDMSSFNSFIKARDPKFICVLCGTNDYSNLPVKSATLDFKDEYAYLNDRVKKDDDLYYEILKDTRTIKADYELDLMTFINEISIDGHLQMLSNIRPGLYERDLEMIFFNYLYKKYYTRIWAYPCIAGANKNGATLHYEVNDQMLKDGGLFLADMGVRFCNYTSDITITIPINGKFTPKQKQIYDIVLKSNLEVQKITKPGTEFYAMDKLSKIIILEELQKMGMLSSQYSVEEMFEKNIFKLFMAHGLGHHLGLDVHDIGHIIKYIPTLVMQEGMIFTVEPGIYFVEFVFNKAFDDPEQRKYLNVDMIKNYLDFGGVRIEDDVYITKDGCINLTKRMPRTTDEIEKYMSENNIYCKEIYEKQRK